MKRSKRRVLLCVVAALGLTGCPDDDDKVMNAPSGAAAAEAAIEDAFDSVIDPLITLMEFAVDYLGSVDGAATDGIVSCPDTTGACNPGSLDCTVGTSALEFAFGDCTLFGSSPALTVDGDVGYTPALPPWGAYNLIGVSVNGSVGLNGVVTLADECNWSWNVTADDGTNTTASLVLCQFAHGQAQYPLSDSSLWIYGETSSGFLSVSFTFDGSRTAGATAFLDESVVAQCSVDLETFDASCTAVEL